MAAEGSIVIKGARVNNLKNISLEIPRGKLVVITGISGSGKSSLAFDTLYAEGQRRFAESLSSYARQFLGRMNKPDVDDIDGIPPAIAIEQKVNIRNPRSTVATTTEIFDFLRLVFAKIGHIYSPVSGREVKASTARDVKKFIDSLRPEGDVKIPLYILADIGWEDREDKVELMLALKEEGFSRFFEFWDRTGAVSIEEVMRLSESGEFPKRMYLLIDRLKLGSESFSEDLSARLLSSIQTAFEKGDGRLTVCWEQDGHKSKQFSSRLEMDGITFRQSDEYLFSFNSPLGACPTCGGLGEIIGISEDLVIPDKSRSIYDEAIACWRGEKMKYFNELLVKNAKKNGISIFEPYCNLTDAQKAKIWEGCPADREEDAIIGINEFFRWVEQNKYKIQYKYMLSRYSGKTTCRDCGGSRLRKEALYVRVGGKNIHELLQMNVVQMDEFFRNLQLDDYDRSVAGKAIEEIQYRLRCIEDVGLGYLTLDRRSNSLSGGESQRVNLVSALGNSLVGSLYILDEPSIGLHPRDTEKLISVLRQLRDLGNTVVVVEHDESIMRAADMLIDIGPKAGEYGGEIVYQGHLDDKLREIAQSDEPEKSCSRSLTLQYLSGEGSRLTRERRKWHYSVDVIGAMEHNLKDIDVKFPLGVLTAVTGVSGSGKSSLVGDVLYPALYRAINHAGPVPGTFRRLEGNTDRITQIEYVDQNPIGKSSRSNAVTYLKIYDDIRKLLSEQSYAKLNGYTPSYFSFNQDGGRCSECQGDGFVKIEMQFMADITMVCDSCGGKRFKPDILEVRYKGKNIDDILNMSVSEAIGFFGSQTDTTAKKIAGKLQALVDVGLSYIRLGQSASTLSGGESQRIKLAWFLLTGREQPNKNQHILFIFDEPTTGLHFYDVEKLLRSFDSLIANGHSIVVVEHNPDVINAADWVIDLGPEAGTEGGKVVFCGTPEDLRKCRDSYTGKYI
ncbi:MAG: excinuclease ABC subunit UvrA [Candidatus Cryptobacteroides sp.]